MRPDHETLITQYTLLPVGRKVSPANVDSSFGQRFEACLQRYRTRRQLAQLTQEQLQDIGLTLEQAQREAGQPFWK